MLTPQQRTRLIPITVALPILVQNMDTTSIATALPTMARDLDVNPLHLNLAITSYLLSLALFLPLSSWFVARFGTRRVYRGALIAFMLGSLACAASHSLTGLIAARVIQGMAGAMMFPLGRAILGHAIPKGEMISAMVWFSLATIIGPVAGPALGGLIVTYASWRWIFVVGVPILAAAFILVTLFIEDFQETERERFDIVSFLLMGVGLAGLVFAFETAGRGLLPNEIVVALLVVGAASMTLYVLHARVSSNPAVDLSLLKLPVFRAVIYGGVLLRTGLGAQPFLLPLLLQLGFGMSALSSGLITMATSTGSLFTRFFLHRLLRALGFRLLLIVGCLLMSALYLAYGQFRPGTPETVILLLFFVGGFGRAVMMTNLNTLGYAEVPRNRLTRATAFGSMAQQLSQSFGVSCGAALLNATLLWRGGEHIGPDDFWPAFSVLAVAPLLALLYFVRLPRDVGAELSAGPSKKD